MWVEIFDYNFVSAGIDEKYVNRDFVYVDKGEVKNCEEQEENYLKKESYLNSKIERQTEASTSE
jgi:hypothetical protein